MKVYLKFKSLNYALWATELLYDLHPIVLEEMLKIKRNFGSVLGKIDLNQLTYEQREQLANLTIKNEEQH